ncbi:MAG: hypothetical protein HYV76_01315 [Candidatus Vogelbacteria bacterium]|nr:hypothetical protein [Candidatus Vogelbacteria bacterium]
MFKSLKLFFDHTEDNIRGYLSHRPIWYAFVTGVGVVLFWRGVWHTADNYPFMSGPMSIIIGSLIMLFSGVFVSMFIGDHIIISGLKGEKKLIEKTEKELDKDEDHLISLEKKLDYLIANLNNKKPTRSKAPSRTENNF